MWGSVLRTANSEFLLAVCFRYQKKSRLIYAVLFCAPRTAERGKIQTLLISVSADGNDNERAL